MDSELELRSTSSNGGIKLYRYRWIVLCLYCLLAFINFVQFLQFTIISDIVQKFYDVGGFAADATGLVFFGIYIILFLPISYLIERYSLKVTAVVSAGLTLAGNLVKLLCGAPDRFYTVLIGQTLCAIGQVYILSIPSKFASVWFGPDEVSTACALAVLGTQLGAAIGSVFTPLLVKNDSDDIGGDLFKMMIYNAAASLVVFGLVIVFFRAKPKLPPSQSQLQLLEGHEDNQKFFENFKILIKNKNFLLILLSFGLFSGIWNSFGIIVNTIYINYFPNGGSDVGIITSITIISGGCIGSVVFGFILDKSHHFKYTSFAVMLLSSLTYILVTYTLLSESRIGTYISIPIFGFFIASGLVISFEFALEVTYPIPESVSCSILNATIFIFAILCTLLFEGLLDAVGYLNTHIVTLVLLLFCTSILFFISANLRRRNANIANGNATANIANGNAPANIANGNATDVVESRG